MNLTYPQAADKLEKSFSEAITASFKELLETKHLYQSVHIDFDQEREKIVKDFPVDSKGRLTIDFFHLSRKEWNPLDPSNRMGGVLTQGKAQERLIAFSPPDVKLFCSRCERTEAFNLVSVVDFLLRGLISASGYHDIGGSVQLFTLSYLCQSCKRTPEVFLVRREGLKLTLSGRSPIEHVDVPRVIPKQMHRFFSGAVVAHQSGQTLAGVFLLRSLIEQWARITTKSQAAKADEVLDAYMNSLPIDFKSRFASMYGLYGELSADIHSATGSAELFDSARCQIVEHFEARRLFKLSTDPEG